MRDNVYYHGLEINHGVLTLGCYSRYDTVNEIALPGVDCTMTICCTTCFYGVANVYIPDVEECFYEFFMDVDENTVRVYRFDNKGEMVGDVYDHPLIYPGM